jgi:hypothetical protein
MLVRELEDERAIVLDNFDYSEAIQALTCDLCKLVIDCGHRTGLDDSYVMIRTSVARPAFNADRVCQAVLQPASRSRMVLESAGGQCVKVGTPPSEYRTYTHMVIPRGSSGEARTRTFNIVVWKTFPSV